MAALFVTVILISSVVVTYSTIRYSTNQEQPQILSAVDETNLALKQVLGFTVGYYGSILQVTGNSSYAYGLSSNYLNSGLANIADIRPEWSTSFVVNSLILNNNWFMNESFSRGELKVTYSLAGLGIMGVTYTASCRLDVQVVPASGSQVSVNVVKDEATPLTDLGRKSFKFYLYTGANLTWATVSPPTEPTSFTNGTYLIDIPPGINPQSYTIQVQDERGISVAASSFSHYTGALTFNSTSGEGGDYVDNFNSAVDGVSDVGLHSSFASQQVPSAGSYDTLTEAAVGAITQAYYPASYNALGSTTLASGTLADLQNDDGNYMTFHAYPSQYSGSATFGYSTKGGSTSDLSKIRGSRFICTSGGSASSISANLKFTSTSNTFGNANTGNSGHTIIDNIRGQRFASPASLVVVQNIVAYIYCTTAAKNMKTAIYDSSGNLVASTNSLLVPANSSPNWQTFTFASPPALTASTNYILVVWSQGGSGSADLRYSSSSGGNGRFFGQAYGSWPSPASFSTNSNQYCVYCNYQTAFNAKAAIYTSTGNALVASTNEKTATTVDGWVTFGFSSQPTLTASTSYVLAVFTSDTSVVVYRDTSSAQRFEASGTYPNWPSSISDQSSQRTYSINCTYTPASEFTCELELKGPSNTNNWNSLLWTIDTLSTSAGVGVTYQLYNYQLGHYPSIGNDGYATATLGLTKTKTEASISVNPADFRDVLGNWTLKIKAVKSTSTPFDVSVDFARYRPSSIEYALSLEEQWTSVNMTELSTRPVLCINSSGSAPDLSVEVWKGGSWHVLTVSLTSGWNNFSVASFLTSPAFNVRFQADQDTVLDSWQVGAVLLRPESDQQLFRSLQDSSATVTVELLQNGSMRWLGQTLQIETETVPIPPVPVKALHVNETVNGVNEEVPFQVEDWASDYTIPLGMTNNATVFGNRQMVVFLVNTRVSEFTIWWNGSDEAVQTPLAFVDTYFQNDDTASGFLSNGVLSLTAQIVNDPIDHANVFKVTSTAGSQTSVAKFMRINGQNSTYGSSPAFVIYHGVVRDVIQQEAEWSNGVPSCPNLYANIVLTLPANASYFTYDLRLMFISSVQARTITNLCPLWLTSPSTQIQTENGTALKSPVVTSGNGTFCNYGGVSPTAHHWSQLLNGAQGAGIMFTDYANQALYAFDAMAGTHAGAIKTDTVAQMIQLLPVSSGSASFQTAQDLTWSGAVTTFAGSTAIYTGWSGLWVLAELPPTVAVRTGN